MVALISDQHSETLVFKSETEQVDMDFDDFDALDHSDRLFDFEVQQTGQQEDTATAGEGFKVMLMKYLETISDGLLALSPMHGRSKRMPREL